ncbi:MAG: carboxypeptidase-like regulatory domain-containing protein, partial [Bacteroidota bacterium]
MRAFLLFFLCCPWLALSQLSITGIVTDFRTGEPLIGANIVLQSRASKGTQTDLEGRFSLQVKNDKDSLVISYIGYKIRKVAIKARMNIRLRTDDQM